MSTKPCRACGFAVLTSASLSACSGEKPPRASVGPATSVAVSLQTLAEPDSGRVIEHLVDRAGRWQATVGTSEDAGPLDISVTCVGGGYLDVTYRVASSGGSKASCDGSTMHNRDEAAGSGAVTVTVAPDGGQRWSLLLVRGMQAG
jgi:hypothetical protein